MLINIYYHLCPSHLFVVYVILGSFSLYLKHTLEISLRESLLFVNVFISPSCITRYFPEDEITGWQLFYLGTLKKLFHHHCLGACVRLLLQ